jgi:NitT/TauT family transport system ATP-binding protein
MDNENYQVLLRRVTKSFHSSSFGDGQKETVLSDVSMSIRRGEFCTIFGPNACGKTTLLRLLAGLIDPDQGEILIGGESPFKAKVGFVFQNYSASLFPWRNAIENIEFPLELTEKDGLFRKKKIHDFLEKFRIKVPLRSHVYELSAGQQQLVCIIRAFITEPKLLLLDEPFGSLDFETRSYMQEKLLEIWRGLNTTVIFVSHDIDESVYLGERIFVFSKRPGRIMKEIQNPLGYPRSKELLRSKMFLETRNFILNIFENEIYEHQKDEI